MEGKVKDILNRRIVSGALSAAMVFNMVAYMPASVFAAAETAEEAVSAVERDGHRYKLYDLPLTWEQAKDYCEKQGGHLMTVTSAEEQQIAEELLTEGGKNSYWLGGHLSDDSAWKWVTDESFDYGNWASGQPDNFRSNENALMVYRKANPMSSSSGFGKWNDLSDDGTCNGEEFFGTENIGFLCEWDQIDDGSDMYNGHKYKLFDDSMTWTEAKAYCESLGGHLVTITTGDEQQFIIDRLIPQGVKNTYFIGLSKDDEQSEWKWVTGEEVDYTNWDRGEPNHANETVVHMYAHTGNVGTWNNTLNYVSGSASYSTSNCGFICEWDLENTAVAEYNGHKYQIFDRSLHWKDAKAYCESLGGHLVTVTDEGEKAFVEKFATERGEKQIYWYGATDEAEEGNWQWVTGEDTALIGKYGAFDNMGGEEDYLALTDRSNWYWNDWGEAANEGNPIGLYAYENVGFICEWDPVVQPIYNVSPYVLFSGSETEDFALYCWKSKFTGDVYTGKNFVSTASELYLEGAVDAVGSVTTYGWISEVEERNEGVNKEEMPDWDARILAMAGNAEKSDADIVRIEDKNVAEGALITSGNVIISGTTFEGNCYIIADGDITYHVNDFISAGKVLLYSRNGNVYIDGTNIDLNGIIYAPHGAVAFNTNITNIKGRVFADKIRFSGSIFNIEGSDSDWELIGKKAAVVKTYTTDTDFSEGSFDGLGLDIADELTLAKRTGSAEASSETEYKDTEGANGIALSVKSDKAALAKPEDTVNAVFDLKGFGTAEVEQSNVDLVIVVDTSGSMRNARRDNAVSAAKEVVSKMKQGDRCAVIKFTTNATVLQDFTDDAELLNTAIDKLDANGGTNIASGINKAVGLFDAAESSNRQKYIILLSDGDDSSASAKAATTAFEKGITICALAIGRNSSQMETIANNTKGYYKNSPTAEQIGEMMNLFADVVFNNAGTDVSFTATLNKNVSVDAASLTPAPAEIIENADGTKTLIWTFNKIIIDQTEEIALPLTVSGVESGLCSVLSDISCTYYNRAGVSKTVYADDMLLPAHAYVQNGSWSTVFDSQTAETEWKTIFWNGRLYDDGVISVSAQAGEDPDAMGEWITVTNHKQLTGLKGRYIRVKTEMEVSFTGKTPELFDLTILSDGADDVNAINQAPTVTISGNDKTTVGKRIMLVSSAEDDAFATQLTFKWSCDSDSVQISHTDKPYTAVKFNEAGTYEITLTVADDFSAATVTKTITVLNDDVLVKPAIEIDVPAVVKSGAKVQGKINVLNGAEVASYEVTVAGKAVAAAADGTFSFTAPAENTIIAVEAKAFNLAGVSGEADQAVTVDATAPAAELKADAEAVFINDPVTVTAVFSDENGIKKYSVTLNGEAVALDANNQFSFAPTAAGTYTFVLQVEDTVGHTASAELTVNVQERKEQPVVHYVVPRVIMLGSTGDFTFVSDSDAVITVKVNGEAVVLDENGAFTYTPSEVGDLTLDIHAENGSGTDTVFTLTVPVVKMELVSTKTAYSDDELVEVKLVYSDNVVIASHEAVIDGTAYPVTDDTVQAEGLEAGQHEIVWTAEDTNGNIYSAALTFAVVDMTAPDVDVKLSQSALKPGDSVTATITATDKYGIKSISAAFDNTPAAISENQITLNDLTAGKHTLTVTAVDNNGNEGTYTYEFVVSSGDNTPPELEINVSVGEDNRITITAAATDDSGSAEISGTINGKKLTFENGTAYYDPESIGTYEIVVRAEDATGNAAVKKQTVTISELIKEYELKLNVGLDKTKVKPNEEVKISVSSNEMLENLTYTCTVSGGTVTEAEGGFRFVSDEEGTFTAVVTVTDGKGNSLSETVYITVKNDSVIIDDEEEDEYINPERPEARARVILKSDEKTETKMTEEMAELADTLKTPLAVYEYLYNNVNVEFYSGSRKGAIGTYEQNGGNDVDCASLLIAMLRYLGYDAEYMTGTVGYTEQQMIDLTAADNFDTALKIFSLMNKEFKHSGDVYYFDHTWVKATVDGKDYDLDISFKKYRKCDNISSSIKNVSAGIQLDDFLDESAMYRYVNGIENAEEETAFSIKTKEIRTHKISKLPEVARYLKGEIKEEIHNILDSKQVKTDYIAFAFGNEVQSVTAPRAFISNITICYVPNTMTYEEFGESAPRDIYSMAQDYIASVQNAISPALYLDNQKIYEWDGACTRIGKLQNLYIQVYSNGQSAVEKKELLVGSVNVITTDSQFISGQSVLTAYDKMPTTDAEKAKLNDKNAYDEKYLGSYLDLLGKLYFAQLDTHTQTFAAANDVYYERQFSYGIISYEPNVNEGRLGVEIQKRGTFRLDILGSSLNSISLKNNDADDKSFRSAVGYISSYLESLILEQATGIDSVSTAKVFMLSEAKGLELRYITPANADAVDALRINAHDKEEVRTAVAAGKTVIVPEEDITFNNWTGTGYIVQDPETGAVSYMLTNGLHGGGTTTTFDISDLLNYFSLALFTFADVYMIAMGLISLVMTGNIIGALILLPFAIYFIVESFKLFDTATDLFFMALDGNADASDALAFQAQVYASFHLLGIAAKPVMGWLGGKLANTALGQKLAAVTQKASDLIWKGNNRFIAANEWYQKWIMKGYSDHMVSGLFKNEKIFMCDDATIEAMLKSGNASGISEILATAPDAIYGMLSASTDKEAAVAFIETFGKEGAAVYSVYGDEAVAAVNNTVNPKKAMQILQEQGMEGLSVYNFGQNLGLKRGQVAVPFEGKVPDAELAQYNADALQSIMQETGYSQAEAEELQSAMQEWFIDHEAFANGEKAAEEAIVNEGLSKMGTYDGTMYRGLSFNDYSAYETFAELEVGAEIPARSLTSWTDQMSVAERFAGVTADQSGNAVLMICDETNTAVGVQHISKFGAAEGEILAPSTSRWTVVEKTDMTKYEYLLQNGQITEDFVSSDLMNQYVTIIRVVEN